MRGFVKLPPKQWVGPTAISIELRDDGGNFRYVGRLEPFYESPRLEAAVDLPTCEECDDEDQSRDGTSNAVKPSGTPHHFALRRGPSLVVRQQANLDVFP